MLFSVVIPVFNVEKYLAECLDSVLAQTTYDMQVLCVNDGSTDSSLRILNEYADKDKRIIVINKVNSGYGDTVNLGIEKASGDYIGIVESDDVVIDGMFQKMLSIADQTAVDIVKGAFNFYTARTNQRILHPNFKNFPCEKIISIQEYPSLFFTAPSIWSAIYRKSFLEQNNIRFLSTPGASYQDTSFAFKTWAVAKSVWLLSEPVIDYRQDSLGSSSNVSKKVFNVFNETAEMGRFIKGNGLECFYPEFVKTKFISYNWTLARLNSNDKIKFFLRWIPELRDEFEKGYFIRKHWNKASWNFIHQLVLNPDLAIKSALSDVRSDCVKFDRTHWLSSVSPVYVYGAGKRALSVFHSLCQKNISVSAFVVSNVRDNPAEVEGIPVMTLEEIDKDGIIFIGVSEKFKTEVAENLREHWLFNNVFEL